MKNFILILFGFFTLQSIAQNQNFLDQPFLETVAEIDTLITPDKIHLVIILNEEDNRNRKSTEELEVSMLRVLNALHIDLDQSLSLLNYSSDFKNFFLSGQKIIKTKFYSLILNDVETVGKVMSGLEREEISNISISKTEYSKSDQLLLDLKSKAVLKARNNAGKMVAALNQKLGKAIYVSDVDSDCISNKLKSKLAGVEAIGYGIQTQGNMMINFEKIKFSTKVKIKFTIE